MGSEPSILQRQVVQAVAMHETAYGNGWHGAGEGSHNWGAVQAGLPPCGDNAFQQGDSIPQDTGGSQPYQACFKVYADDVAGAQDVVRLLTKQMPLVYAAMNTGDFWDIAAAMYDSHYFGGFGNQQDALAAGFATPREFRIWGYANALYKCAQEIAAGNNEPLMLTLSRGGSSFGTLFAKGLAFAIALGAGIVGIRYAAKAAEEYV